MAHAQGYLTRPSLNMVQDWALRYFLDMQRRSFIEDKEAELDRQLLYANPEAWERVHAADALPEQEPETPVTDLSDLDKWVQNMNTSRTVSGADVPNTPFLSFADKGDRT